jgi:hypothetical protein
MSAAGFRSGIAVLAFLGTVGTSCSCEDCGGFFNPEYGALRAVVVEDGPAGTPVPGARVQARWHGVPVADDSTDAEGQVIIWVVLHTEQDTLSVTVVPPTEFAVPPSREVVVSVRDTVPVSFALTAANPGGV